MVFDNSACIFCWFYNPGIFFVRRKTGKGGMGDPDHSVGFRASTPRNSLLVASTNAELEEKLAVLDLWGLCGASAGTSPPFPTYNQ